MLGSRLNLIATVIGFGLSATFIVFICTRLIWGRLRRLQSRRRFGIVTRINLDHQAEQRINDDESAKNPGVLPAQFNREMTKDTRCAICLAEYQDKESLRIMPKCGHIFHLICIDTWLRKHSTCPICRLSIQDSGRTKHKNTLPASLSASMPFESYEISIEPSQSTEARIESDSTREMNEDSVSGTGRGMG